MSKDTISLLSDMRSQYNCFDPDEEKYYRALSEAIKALRTAQSERKKGKWMIDPLRSTANDIHQVYRLLRCSECGHQEPWPWLTRKNFCPNCGADMR